MQPTPELEAMIAAAATRHGIRPELLRALVQHESGFDPNAVGDGGRARGLCQLHPEACSDVGANWLHMFNPAANLDAGASYLAVMLDEFESERTGLAAYNGGPGTMRHGPGARFFDQAVRYADTVLALVRTEEA